MIMKLIITAGKTHDFSRGMRGGAPYYKYHGAKKYKKLRKQTDKIQQHFGIQ